MIHNSGLINNLDAVIVTDSTATATPTTTPTATITGTLTVSVTPGTTPIPTETPPPPLQEAAYTYDGDGNMVKGIVNGVETYYPGRHYNEEVDGSTSTVKKFYTLGSTTVAVRTVSGTENVLNWILGDHLGSASVTANADGSWNSEIKYTAFGEVRASSGLTPTEYRYTGQLEQNSLGLYFYVARWYDPALLHFVQADTIIPFPNSTNSFDRYSYTHNNPIIYTDDSGHVIGAVAALGIAMGLGAIASYAIQVGENRTQGMDWGEALTTDISPEKIMGGALIAGGVVVGAAVAAFGLTAIGVTAGAACADGDCTNEVQVVSQTISEGVENIDDLTSNAPINTGNISVYQSVDIEGNPQYFGITNNPFRRIYEHLHSPRNMKIEEIPGLTNLSRYDARAVEQVLIEDRGLDNLLNKINSIATTNKIYTHAIQRGNEILDSIRYARNIPK